MQAHRSKLDDLVQRIIQEVQPLRIILFGSTARGDSQEGSDVDLLIVMPEGTHRRRTAQHLHQRLIGFPLAVDILVTTPAALAKHRDNIGLIYRTILAEGEELYAA